MKEEIERRTVAFYKVRVRENETTRRHWIFKAGKASVHEIFKHRILTDFPKEKAPLEKNALESIEFL
jgi:hypothetical protein